jgi:hypothetical protein
VATIVTRAGKGAALTHQEVDANFTGLNTELGQKEVASNKGVANGYASLDAAGKVPSAQLPSYVDDVVEVANFASLPGTGETGKIYVTIDANKTYRWTGSTYIEISASPGSTDSLAEGSTNLYFTQARARASISASGSLSYNSSTGVMSFSDAVTSVAGRTGAVTLTSSDVGLANVENKSSATIRGELTSSNVTTALGYTPLSLAGGTMTGAITFAAGQTWPTFNQSTTGSAATLTTGRTIGMTGDVTWTSGAFNGSANVTGTATLANSGVTAGTYTKVTVDAKGRVTSATTLAAGDVPTLNQNTTGSAATLTTARTINGTSFNGSANITTANWGTARTLTIGSTGKSVDGSANVSWSLAEIGALASGAKAADADLLDGYNSTAFSGPVSTIKQFFWNDLSASGTQARTYEIARLGIDYNDWNSGSGPFEVELYEAYYSRGLKKKYVIHWGYTNTYGIQLVEYSGNGDNNFQCRVGAPVLVSGDNYYLPVFVDVKYYAGCDVRVTTNRDITASNPPAIGTTFINASPSATNISDFTADSTVNFASTTAVQISGSQLLHAGNYSSYALPLSGGSLTGNITLTQGTDRLISIGSSTNWSYTLKSEGDQFRLYDGNGTNFLYGVYNGGGTGKYLQLLGSNFVVNNNGTVTASGNQILHAGNYSGYALPLTGGTLSGKLTITASAGLDLFRLTFDADGTDSWYRAGSGNRHRFTTTGGADFIIGNGSGVATLNGNQLLTAGNYTSYSPSLTGSGASGTWGINVTGNAATATTASNSTNLGGSAATYYDHRRYTDSTTYLGGYYVSGGSEKPNNAIFGAGKLKIAMLSGGNLGFGGSWNDVLWMSTYTGGDVKPSYAIVGDKYSDELYFSRQNYDSASWGTGRRILHSGNYTSFSPSLTGSGASGTWSINVTGTAGSISGYNNPTTAATANTIVYRDSGGDISGRYFFGVHFNQSSGNSENPSIAAFWTNSSADNYCRKSTPAHVISQLGLLTTSNYSSYALPLSGGTVTGSTTFNSSIIASGRDIRIFENDSFIEFYVGGDANTYYPVRFDVYAWFHFGSWSISRSYADPAPWDPIGTGAHRGGLTLTWEWSGDGAWGGNDKTIRVNQFSEQYTTMVGGLALSVNGFIVWLRGGNAYYRFHGPGGMYKGATPYYSTYTASNGATFSPRSYNSATVASEVIAKMPIRGESEHYDGNNRVLHAGNYTSYTVPVSGGTFTGNVKINPQGESWGEGLSFMMPSTSTWGGLRWQRQRSGYDGNWAVGYTALDSSDDLVFVANNGGSQVNDILRLTKAGNVSTSGSFTASGNVTAYSDERVKANWRTLDDGFVVNLSNVKSGIYDRTDIEITQVGVSAQSLRDVLPHAVIEANDGDLSVAYGNAAMVSAVELAKELVALKNEVAELRARIH